MNLFNWFKKKPSVTPSKDQDDLYLAQGLEQHQQGNFAQAQACYEMISPDSPIYHLALGNLAALAMQSQQYHKAVPLLGQALARRPDFVDGHCNLGTALEFLGQLDEAEKCYRKALALKPDHQGALYNLGNTLNRLNRLHEAEACYRQSLALKPDHHGTLFNLGNTLANQGRFDQAKTCYIQLLALRPNHIAGLINLGDAHKELAENREAETCYRQALALEPNDLEALNNLAGLAQIQGHLQEAENLLRQLLALKPDFAYAHYNLGTLLLMTQRWKEGWAGYEFRWFIHKPTQEPKPNTSLPQWRGEIPSPGAGLLLFAEQGFGDALQMARYLPLLTQRFAKVALVVSPPLTRLFQDSFPVEILNQPPLDQSPWQWHYPLLSLPLAFQTTPATVPNQTPYLVVDPHRAALWDSRLKQVATNQRRVGLVWAGNRQLEDDAKRSIPLALFAPLLNLSGTVWISLQKGEYQDKSGLPETLSWHDWMEETTDFADTAALISQLDLVLAVDTAVAHLAGALAKPVWLLNRYESEWRWMWQQTESPWYPSMRLFNQPTPGDWPTVIMQIKTALEKNDEAIQHRAPSPNPQI